MEEILKYLNAATAVTIGIESENLPNGISVSLRKSIMDTALLGKSIAQFMVCSYVAKNKVKICPNGGTMTYNPIVNLVLDTVDVNYVSIFATSTYTKVLLTQ